MRKISILIFAISLIMFSCDNNSSEKGTKDEKTTKDNNDESDNQEILPSGDYEVIITPKSSRIEENDTFEAEISLKGNEFTSIPKIFIGNFNKETYQPIGDDGVWLSNEQIIDGKGIYKTLAAFIGVKSFTGFVELETTDGLKRYPFYSEYFVVPASN